MYDLQTKKIKIFENAQNDLIFLHYINTINNEKLHTKYELILKMF